MKLHLKIWVYASLLIGCINAPKQENGRSGVVESTGQTTAGARVIVPEGSAIDATAIRVTDADQKTAEEAVAAQIPEDVTASYLVGTATYIAVPADTPQSEVMTLSGLLPLLDKNGDPITGDRIPHVGIVYHVALQDGSLVIGSLIQSTGNLAILGEDELSLQGGRLYAKFALQGIEGTYTLVWPEAEDGSLVESQQLTQMRPKPATKIADSVQETDGGAEGETIVETTDDGATDDGTTDDSTTDEKESDGGSNKPAYSAADDLLELNEDASGSLNVLDNDIVGSGFTLAIKTLPTKGASSLAPDGALTYTPLLNSSGNDSLVYVLTDPEGTNYEATVTIKVAPVNDVPVPIDDAYTVSAGSGTTDFAVLDNDSDVDGDLLEIVAVGSATVGSAAIKEGGQIIAYTAPPSGADTATFTYTVQDPSGAQASATVTVTIEAENSAPVAVADVGEVDEDQSLILSVLANDSDPDGDAITILSISAPAKGTAVKLNGDTQIRYEPDPNENGADSFTYTITDGRGGTDQAAVSMIINAVNDPPTFTTLPVDVLVPVGTDIGSMNIDLSATDIDDDDLTWQLLSSSCGGSLLIDSGTGDLAGLLEATGYCTVEVSVSDSVASDTKTVVLLGYPYVEAGHTNLALWLEGSDLTERQQLEQDNSVAIWHDWSGNGHHAEQNVVDLRPSLIIDDDIGYKAAVKFDEDNEHHLLFQGSAITSTMASKERTVIVVAKMKEKPSTLISLSDNVTGNNALRIRRGDDDEIQFDQPRKSENTTITAEVSGDQYRVYGFRTTASGASHAYVMRHFAGGAGGAAMVPDGTPSVIGAGYFAGTLNGYLEGAVAEVLIFSTDIGQFAMDETMQRLHQKYNLSSFSDQTVFVTKEKHVGDLGGLSGADEKCELAAKEGRFYGKNWRALLSVDSESWGTSDTTARERLNIPGAIYNSRGEGLASDADDFFDGSLKPVGILDQYDGLPVDLGLGYAWSNVSSSGGAVGVEDCGGWTSTTGTGNAAYLHYYDQVGWLSSYLGPDCSTLARLYCVSDP